MDRQKLTEPISLGLGKEHYGCLLVFFMDKKNQASTTEPSSLYVCMYVCIYVSIYLFIYFSVYKSEIHLLIFLYGLHLLPSKSLSYLIDPLKRFQNYCYKFK